MYCLGVLAIVAMCMVRSFYSQTLLMLVTNLTGQTLVSYPDPLYGHETSHQLVKCSGSAKGSCHRPTLYSHNCDAASQQSMVKPRSEAQSITAERLVKMYS